MHYGNWCQVTNNSFVLSVIQFGLKIQFHTLPPFLVLSSSPPSPARILAISSEVSSLHAKTAISIVTPSPDQFVSPIFDVPKRDSDDCRVILNLKVLNNYICKIPFRLEGYDVIISMLRQGDYMISIDLKDAFLMFLLHCKYHRFFCFEWQGVRYCYTCMPFGLTSAPRVFTKVLKSVLVFLRSKGLRISAWFDDMILMAENIPLLLEHLYFARLILRSLGFIINSEKSSLVPTQVLQHLGYIWNSDSFTLSVPDDKVVALKDLCSQALKGPVTLRFLQRILGTIESFRFAFNIAALHYRSLQREVAGYIASGSNWDLKISPSPCSKVDLEWWVSCPIPLLPRSLAPFVADIIVTTDSSNDGWGAYSSLEDETFGFWSEAESKLHINVLESMAVVFAFKCFFRDVSSKSILIRSDNSTTVSYINHLGGVKSQEVSDLMIELYNFCLVRNLSIKASFLRGRCNNRADALSRRSRTHCYSLPSDLFLDICKYFNINPVIDLFADRHNMKIPRFFSESPDPLAQAYDAFTVDWPDHIYAFPPINLVGKFLSYFEHFNLSSGLLISPYWPAQSYFPKLLSLLIDSPLLFPVHRLEGSAKTPRPLLYLMASHISCQPERRKAYLAKLLPECSKASTLTPSALTCVPGQAFQLGVLNGKSIMAKLL